MQLAFTIHYKKSFLFPIQKVYIEFIDLTEGNFCLSHFIIAQANVLLKGHFYDVNVPLPQETILELCWLVENVRNWNGRAIISLP